MRTHGVKCDQNGGKEKENKCGNWGRKKGGNAKDEGSGKNQKYGRRRDREAGIIRHKEMEE